jgi:hypothetical protein
MMMRVRLGGVIGMLSPMAYEVEMCCVDENRRLATLERLPRIDRNPVAGLLWRRRWWRRRSHGATRPDPAARH